MSRIGWLEAVSVAVNNYQYQLLEALWGYINKKNYESLEAL